VSALVAYPDGQLGQLSAAELNYSYRTSALQGKSVLVLEATLKLQPGFTREQMMQLTTDNFKHRKNTQPYDKPSCGSVFRNPKSKAAGWLIEQVGLKGYQIGGAQVAHRHANFIINCGHATADDIFRLIGHVQEQVEHHWSILLQPEVKFLGQF
jgi:UDP-N-acetylmuramate dehydrogenase